jgi:hypothetical protein
MQRAGLVPLAPEPEPERTCGLSRDRPRSPANSASVPQWPAADVLSSSASLSLGSAGSASPAGPKVAAGTNASPHRYGFASLVSVVALNTVMLMHSVELDSSGESPASGRPCKWAGLVPLAPMRPPAAKS